MIMEDPMIGIVLAGAALGAVTLAIAKSRPRPEPKPVRVEAKDGNSPRGR